MKAALILAAVTAAWLIPIGVRRLIRNFKQAQATFDTIVAPAHEPIVDLGTADDLQLQADLEADEADHIARLALVVTFVPDGFTCLGCGENPALPYKVLCAVCDPASLFPTMPSSPIERGQR